MGLEKHLNTGRAGSRAAKIYIITIAVCLAFLAGIVLFLSVLGQQNRKSVKKQLQNYAHSAGEAVENQLRGDFQTLEAVAFCISKMENVNEVGLRSLLKDINFSNDFSRLGYASPDGNAEMLGIDGSIESENYASSELFIKAMEGERIVLNNLGKDGASYAVPVMSGGKTVGALVAENDSGIYSKIIDINMFNGRGYCGLTDKDGSFIICSATGLIPEGCSSIFDMGAIDSEERATITAAMAAGESGSCSFKDSQGEKTTAVYVPVAEEWYIFCMVSGEPSGGLFKTAAAGTVALFICVLAALFFLMVLFAGAMRREQESMRLQTARYQILLHASRDIVFEYDCVRDLFSYTCVGLNDELVQGEIADYLKNRKYRKVVRVDYWDAFEEVIEESLKRAELRTSEAPVKIFERGYFWHRITIHSIAGGRGAVTNVVGSAIDVNELVLAREKAIMEASIDSLTGALSRKAFTQKASEFCCGDAAESSSLLMLDLDDFKEVNDTCGHMEGDRKLILIVSLLGRVFSAEDLIGRYGGDEFVVFMKNIGHDTVDKKLEQFKLLLSREQKDDSCEITCSVGVIEGLECGVSVDKLLQKADEAMYRAKNAGKNRVVRLGGMSGEQI